MSVGGAVKYSALSRQPMKIGGGGNVGTIGNLDINTFLTYEAHNILNELLAPRSDHHRIKRKMYSTIASTGDLYNVTPEDNKMDRGGGTAELKQVYMTTLGLLMK